MPLGSRLLAALTALGLLGEPGRAEEPNSAPAKPTAAAELPDDLPNGLLLALAQFEVSPEGKVLPKPGPARLDILLRRGGAWQVETIEDPASNVFHKAMVFTPPGAAPGILTLGGSAAALKLWRRGAAGFAAETLWQADFGGKFSRLRDAEAADLYGDGFASLALATHDQGVVATARPQAGGEYAVRELDRRKDTFVHEIEVGDLDGDGVAEVYATPSEPNRFDGTPQPGQVVRYVPRSGQGPTVVADLGTRHAKEILVADLDGDDRDELYVSVESESTTAPIEIRRYDAGTPADQGRAVATIDDRLCRFLSAGDLDGDGRAELVAAGYKSGLWLLRPSREAERPWTVESIDRDSSGFEHASLVTDLDGDGTAELYVASDDQGVVRRYVWNGVALERSTIFERKVPRSVLTWNIMPVPAELLRAGAPPPAPDPAHRSPQAAPRR